MYIRTDDDHNIIGAVSVGTIPSDGNVYEIESIEPEILYDIFSYKYIDGEFVKNPNFRSVRIEDIKNTKILNMNRICENVITNGIDYNGEHYTLTTNDQINIMKLESEATLSPSTPKFYHADNQICRQYTNEEIQAIAALSMGWVTFHITYFNILKDQIKQMTDVDEIISAYWGMSLDTEHQSLFEQITTGINFQIERIEDDYDYENFFPKIDVDEFLRKAGMVTNQSDETSIDESTIEDTIIDPESIGTVEVYPPDEDVTDDTSEEVISNDEESTEVSE
jgi:hypothetical protein